MTVRNFRYTGYDGGGIEMEDTQKELNDLREEIRNLKIELTLAKASLRSCYNSAAGALDLKTSDRQ